MQSGIYVGLSGQLALNQRLDTIAHNVANVSTAGFRAEEVKFDDVLSRVPPNPVAFASPGDTFLLEKSGPVVRTDNPLDVAVQGEAWLAIELNGQPVYTRDGRMQISPEGALQSLGGYSMLDIGGAPIVLNPNGGAPEIGKDGTIFQDGQRRGALGLFQMEPGTELSRGPNSGVVPDRPALPAVDFVSVGVQQGFVERSNVNPVMEMTRLIEIHRMFDAVTNSLNTADESLQKAIRQLGPSA